MKKQNLSQSRAPQRTAGPWGILFGSIVQLLPGQPQETARQGSPCYKMTMQSPLFKIVKNFKMVRAEH